MVFSPGGSAGAAAIGPVRSRPSLADVFTDTSSSLTRFGPFRKSSGWMPNVSTLGDSSAAPSSTITIADLGVAGRHTPRPPRHRAGRRPSRGRRRRPRSGPARSRWPARWPARRSWGRGCGRRPGRPTTKCWNAPPDVPRPRFRSRSTPSGDSGRNGFRRATSHRPPNRPGGEPSAKRLDWPPWTRAEVGNQCRRITSTARSIA